MLRAAAGLLQTGGIKAVSTRAVAAARGCAAATIYRQFGDKDGLLDAVAGFVLQDYMEKKRLLTDASRYPAVELRDLWDLHAEFGLNQPDCWSARPVISVLAERDTFSFRSPRSPTSVIESFHRSCSTT